ncbi:hypothetical protein ACFXJ5_18075 [Streptomyces sp. NPDC059373]
MTSASMSGYGTLPVRTTRAAARRRPGAIIQTAASGQSPPSPCTRNTSSIQPSSLTAYGVPRCRISARSSLSDACFPE